MIRTSDLNFTRRDPQPIELSLKDVWNSIVISLQIRVIVHIL